jgi:hypothetical protein
MNVHRSLALVHLFVLAACAPGGGFVPIVEQVPRPIVTPLPEDLPSRPLILDRVVIDIARGTILGEARRGTLCVFAEPHRWNSEPRTFTNGIYHSEFDRIVSQNNFQLFPKPSSLFDSPKLTGYEMIVAGRITHLTENFCGAINVWAGNQPVVKGSVRLTVRWEVYSVEEEKVVLTFENQGSAVQPDFAPLAETLYGAEAFGNALRGLLVYPEFRDIVTKRPKPKAEL